MNCYRGGIGLIIGLSAVAHAAEFTLGEKSAMPNEQDVQMDVLIVSGPEEDVSGVQFDLVFDGAALIADTIVLGDAALSADKDLSTNMLDENTVRVVVTGFNQTIIPDGTLLMVFFDVAGSAPPAQYDVTLERILLSDPFGFQVPAEVVPGTIEVVSGGGNGDGSNGSGCAAGEAAYRGAYGRSVAGDSTLIACVLMLLTAAGWCRSRT